MFAASNRRKTTLLALLIWLASISAPLCDDAIRFNHIGIEQGLSDSTVLVIVQDPTGFMWFGTANGLNRYDGYTFRSYLHDPLDPNSLSHNWIDCMLVDSKGDLWIGTKGGGLNRFDRETETFVHYRHDPDNPSSISHDIIRAIVQDHQGRYWVGTYQGLNRLDPQTGQAVRYYHQPNNHSSLSHNEITRLCLGADGCLWVGTINGLNRFDPDSGRVKRFLHDPSDPDSLDDDFIEALLVDHSGYLWVGSQKGVNRYNPHTETFTHYAKDPIGSYAANIITVIFEDSRNNVWIGAPVGGLKRLDRKTGHFTYYRHDPENPFSIASGGIASVYEDRGGVIWLGLSQKGLNWFDFYSQKFETVRHDSQNPRSLDSNAVFCFWEDRQGKIWVGTSNAGGLNRTDSSMTVFDHFSYQADNVDSLVCPAVMTLFEDHEGVFWVGAYCGLDRFDPHKGTFRHYRHDPDDPFSISANPVRTIYEDKRCNLWIGVEGGGLNRFDRASERFIRYQHDPHDPHGISGSSVIHLFEDSDNLLWICTTGGVGVLDRASDKFIRYEPDPDDPRKINSPLTASIWESPLGVLWFGTAHGLNKYDKRTGIFTLYGKNEGLAHETIGDILADNQGCLWLNTGKGISVFDPQTERFRNFDLSDGLQGPEFNRGAVLKTRDGYMLFGGMNGFNRFHPDHIKDNPYTPPIVITDFQLFNESVQFAPDSILTRPIHQTDQITLAYTHDVFSFEFAALNYAYPEKNRYAYMLEGFDAQWINSGERRFATYTNLPPGAYTFRVKGSNNDGVWNEQGASIYIHVSPPPWKTWWAYCLFGMAVFAALYAFYWYMKRKVETAERMARMEEQLHQARKMESLGQLAGGIAHDFNNILASVIGFSQFALKNEIPPDSEARDSIEEILKAGYRAQDIVQGILAFSRKSEAEKKRVKLSEVIAEVLKFLRASIPKSIQITRKIDAHDDVVWASPSQMAQVVMNLCANAEHAMRGGVGELTIMCDAVRVDSIDDAQALNVIPGGYVRLTVKDTGCGMTPEVMKQIFEPYYTTKDLGEGTGFGLAVVHGIVADHGGDIRVSSRPGKGTTFKIFLPHHEEAPEEDALSESDPLPKGDERILLIDDEAQVLKYHWKLLTRLGYHVTPVEQSNRAYELFQSRPHDFDLIITDLTMPGMTGMEIAQKIKKIRANIPIILYTGYMGMHTQTQMQAVGIDLVLTKPVDDREMAVKLRNVLDGDGQDTDHR